MAFNAQGFIQDARSHGVPDKEIYNYLQSKNLLNTTPQQTPISSHPVAQYLGNSISNAFKSGVQQVKEGFSRATKPGGSALDLVEGSLKGASGLINTVASPLAPVMTPISKGIETVAEGYSNIPAVQRLANSKVGDVLSHGAEDVANLANIAGAVGGSKFVAGKVGGVASELSSGVSKLSQAKENFINPSPVTKSTKAINSLEKTYNELFTGTKSSTKQFNKSVDMGKSPSRFLAENGIVLDVNNKGKIVTKSAIDKIEANAAPVESMLGKLLEAKDKQLPEANRISLDQLGQLAKERITTSENKAGGYLSKQYGDIDRMVNEWKQYYGDSINLTELNQIKSGQWKQSRVFDATRPSYTKDVHYNVAKVAQKMVEDSVPEAEIKNLNSYLGDHYETIKNLSKVEGNAVKGGMLTRQFSKIGGGIVGSGFGPLGGIAGMATGEYIQQIIQSNSIAGPLKVRALREIPKSSPVFDMAQKAIMQIETGKKLLPAPTNTTTSPKSIKVRINRAVIQQQAKKYPGGLDNQFKGRGALSKPN